MNIKKLQKALESMVGERINIEYRSTTTKSTSIEKAKVMAVSEKSIFLIVDRDDRTMVTYPKPYIEVAIENVTKVTFY